MDPTFFPIWKPVNSVLFPVPASHTRTHMKVERTPGTEGKWFASTSYSSFVAANGRLTPTQAV